MVVMRSTGVLSLSLLLVLLPTSSALPTPHADILLSNEPLTSLTFGSCNKEDKPQPMWEFIQGGNGTTSTGTPLLSPPHAFVWLGDVIYGDSIVWPFAFIRYPSSMEVMRSKYALQASNPGYQTLVQSEKTHVVGVWDDHDYGMNDGDHHYTDRSKTQTLFLDFMNEAQDSKRRTRQGVYASYMWGPQGHRVLLILLDIRYHQDYETDDILGVEQWTWLEQTLTEQDVDPQLIIIGSGIQIVSRDKPIGEGWKSFPKSKSRLFHLLHTSNMKRRNRWNQKYGSSNSTTSHPFVPAAHLFLSGDVHFSEISTTSWCEVHPTTTSTTSATSTTSYHDGDELWIYPLVDITSSGLTHSIGHQTRGLIDLVYDHFIHPLHPVWFRENFGRLDIHWDSRSKAERHPVNPSFPQPPSFSSRTFVHVNVYNETGGVSPVSAKYRLSDLQPTSERVSISSSIAHPSYPLEPVAHLIPNDCVIEQKLTNGQMVLYSLSGIKFAWMIFLAAVISFMIAIRVCVRRCGRSTHRPTVARQTSLGKKTK